MDTFTKTYLKIINNIKPKKKALVKESWDSDIDFLCNECGFYGNGYTMTKSLTSEKDIWLEIYPGQSDEESDWIISISGNEIDEPIYLNDEYGNSPVDGDLKSAIETSIKNTDETKKTHEDINPDIIDKGVTELQAILAKMSPVEG